jgi:hypothetical protein
MASKRFQVIRQLGSLLSTRKKWWLFPVVGMLLLIGVLVVFAGNSAIAPFIYALF